MGEKPYRLSEEAKRGSAGKKNPPPAPSRGEGGQIPAHRVITGVVVGACGLGVVAALLLGDGPTEIATCLVAACVLQGMWAGAATIAGVVIGMLIALALATPMGKAIEGSVASLTGSHGVANRSISIAIAGGAIVLIVGFVVGLVGRGLMRKRPSWRAWNRHVGAIVGGVEGLGLALVVVYWAPMAAEPIAQAQLAQGENPTAERVVKYVRGVRETSVGRALERSNPLEVTDIFAIARDFAEVSRDPRAMERLLNSDVMKRIGEMRSVQDGMARLRQDPELAPMFERGGVSAEDIRVILENPTVLKVMDETRVRQDLSPLGPELIEAIRKAKNDK